MGYLTSYKIETLDNIGPTSTRPNCKHNYSEIYNFCPECGKPRLYLLNIEDIIIEVLKELHPEFGNFNPFSDACKWYSHAEDMKQISKQYPHIVFVLKGQGEESADLWIKYFRNGKMQETKAKVTFEEFNERLLK